MSGDFECPHYERGQVGFLYEIFGSAGMCTFGSIPNGASKSGYKQGKDGRWYCKCPCRGNKSDKKCKVFMSRF